MSQSHLPCTPPELVFLSSHLPTLLPPSPLLTSTLILSLLTARYVPRHWHVHNPERGSGYRAISYEPHRGDGYLDPVLEAVGREVGWGKTEMRTRMKKLGNFGKFAGWTIWCDPGCVSWRSAASGTGEIKSLWGYLPSGCNSTSPLRHSSQPVETVRTQSHARTVSQPSNASPLKSRAIPILAPSTVVRGKGIQGVGVTPPTPVAREEGEIFSDDEEEVPARDVFRALWPAASANGAAHPPVRSLSPVAAADPFHRPSSRSSDSSLDSDSSLFSQTGSSVTTASSTAIPTPPASKSEQQAFVYPAASARTFGRYNSTPALPLAPVSQEPRKRQHSSSSSISSANGLAAIPRPRSAVGDRYVVKDGPGTVTEHSGGKVGVMGGGVMLGLPRGAAPSVAGAEEGETKARRRGGRRGRGGAQGHGAWHGGSVSSSVGSWEEA